MTNFPNTEFKYTEREVLTDHGIMIGWDIVKTTEEVVRHVCRPQRDIKAEQVRRATTPFTVHSLTYDYDEQEEDLFNEKFDQNGPFADFAEAVAVATSLAKAMPKGKDKCGWTQIENDEEVVWTSYDDLDDDEALPAKEKIEMEEIDREEIGMDDIVFEELELAGYIQSRETCFVLTGAALQIPVGTKVSICARGRQVFDIESPDEELDRAFQMIRAREEQAIRARE